MDAFYEDITAIIRGDEKFDAAKMNIIKANSDRCEVDYDEKKCKTFKFIKEWEKNL